MKNLILTWAFFALSAWGLSAVTESDVLGPKEKKTPDIVEYLQQSGQFKVLLSALKAADLTETLKSEGDGFTLLAPTDDAFHRLPVGFLDPLLEPSGKQKLAALLGLHIIPGKFSTVQLFVSGRVKTFQGQQLPLRIMAGNYLFDEAKLIQADIPCSNGLIQVVDRVIVPLP